jgi:hypothetical protein
LIPADDEEEPVRELRDSIQLQVSTLLIDEDGRLTERIQAARTLRSAILLDLVAVGVLENDRDHIEIDPSPDVLPLAARLTKDMADKADEDLVWWAHHDGISVKDAAQEMVELGLWERHSEDLGLEHRYRWRDEHADLAVALRSAVGASYEEADHRLIAPNLALVGGLWGHEPRPPDDDVVADLGRTNWLVPDLMAYLWNSATLLGAVRVEGPW